MRVETELGTNIPDVFKFSIIKRCTVLTQSLGLADRIKRIPWSLLRSQLHLEELKPQLDALRTEAAAREGQVALLQ